ncbi:hypothetical protein D5086_026272 [Populus alba]|uniref:Uncharacterized protein n=1 Tax=Populus alba TaxID=43335 RepID=A0ACC4B1H6_POPAL
MSSSTSSYEENNAKEYKFMMKQKQGAPTVTVLADQQRKESKTISAAGMPPFVLAWLASNCHFTAFDFPNLNLPFDPWSPTFRCLPSTCNN